MNRRDHASNPTARSLLGTVGTRVGAIVAAVAVAAAGMGVVAAGPASANGNCATYWGVNELWSGAPAAGGTGTVNDPYLVGSQTDLEEVRFCSSANFKQIADIALTNYTSIPDLYGTYNGDGHTISGLTINMPNADTYGLFRTIDGGAFTNVNLTGVSISADVRSNIGAAAGQAINGATISGVTVDGTVAADGSVGGLVGYLESSTVSDSSSSADVSSAGGDAIGGLVGKSLSATISNSAASGAVSGAIAVGGLVGSLATSSISGSSAAGVVAGTNAVGGLVGLSRTDSVQVINSYAAGNVSATTDIAGGLIGTNITAGLSVINSYETGAVAGPGTTGGLIGSNALEPAEITGSFWNSTANPGITGGSGIPQTEPQLQSLATFTEKGWAIQVGAPATGQNVWGICSPTVKTVNGGFPFLLWSQPTNPCSSTPVPPTPTTQTPVNNCVTAGTSSTAIPQRGPKRLMKAGCTTNAGQRVGVRVNASQRGDASYYSLRCKASSSKFRKVTRSASGAYCKSGALQIVTKGYKLRLRVTWSAPATYDYAPYSKVKVYRT